MNRSRPSSYVTRQHLVSSCYISQHRFWVLSSPFPSIQKLSYRSAIETFTRLTSLLSRQCLIKELSRFCWQPPLVFHLISALSGILFLFWLQRTLKNLVPKTNPQNLSPLIIKTNCLHHHPRKDALSKRLNALPFPK